MDLDRSAKRRRRFSNVTPTMMNDATEETHNDDDDDDDKVVVVRVKPPPVAVDSVSAQRQKKLSAPAAARNTVTMGTTLSRSRKINSPNNLVDLVAESLHIATPPVIQIIDDGDDNNFEDQKMPARPRKAPRAMVDLTMDDNDDDNNNHHQDFQFSMQLAMHQSQEDFDRALALQLEQEHQQAHRKVQQAHAAARREMKQTHLGKAVTFVQGLVNIQTELQNVTAQHPNFLNLVARDDIVALAERTFVQQDAYKATGRPFAIDLGFHYTNAKNLESIKMGGLLTKKDRESNNIKARHNGSAYGDGVYTARGPFDTWNQRYGSTGLLVARLQGRTGTCKDDANINTVVTGGSYAVLKTSEQCIALFQFDGKQLKPNEQAQCPSIVILKPLCEKVQNLINKLLNEGTTLPQSPDTRCTKVTRINGGIPLPGAAGVNPSRPPGPLVVTTTHKSTKTMDRARAAIATQQPFFNAAAATAALQQASTAAAAPPPAAVGNAGNVKVFTFPRVKRSHTHTVTAAPSVAPVVATSIASIVYSASMTPQEFASRGSMPSGSMTAQLKNIPCAGFSIPQSIMITYTFPQGTQRPYHPHPYQSYVGRVLTAYLPDNQEGHRLLHRLVEAFRLGFTFKLQSNPLLPSQATVSGFLIPHKTEVVGGAATNGFPDPTYFDQCHAALDRLGVKKFA